MEELFSDDSLFDLIVWGGVIIFYLLNIFLKKSSEEKVLTNDESLHEDSESIENPFEEIRREILSKKKARSGLERREVELAMEANKPSDAEAKSPITREKEQTPFQLQAEKQAKNIKKRQKEAEQLNIDLEHIKKQSVTEMVNECLAPNRETQLVRNKVFVMLRKKSDIKAALIAGEIIAKPLSDRKNFNN